ncbi:Uma2 family endonuclease [Dyadobacter luticola]|uniref:Uma2 family endonuclease n=1 Tax=Dyadobacter luticola TaxID=1979387 RepID=A0A5R9KY47_9BACT|nr:Uma2 family endonuclease [Dyadobacter luticola]TLV01236.1 Uma2 family endonuclease [Dyadobacter luticola]
MKTMEATITYNPDLTQIINGEEVMSPSPFIPHQRVQIRLLRFLGNHVEPDNLGELFVAPLDVIFEEGFNVLQPDIIFISRENQDIMKEWIRGVPDLVVEIVSKSSVKMDTVIKKEIYERYGVPECWIVFPDKTKIEIFELVNGKYQLSGSYQGNQEVSSPALPGLHFKASAIF